KMPLVINLSFGNNYGSHDGTSLLESYINEIAAREQVTIVIGAGNEGNAGGHTSGILKSGDREAVEIAVSTYQMAMNLQIWKNYADEFELEVQSPGGRRTGILAETNEVSRYRFAEEGTDLLVYYGTAKPYSIYQEIYLEFMPVDTFIRSGIWTVMLYGVRSAVGEYHMWLPVEAALGTSTRFLLPQPDTTMTIPSTATAAVTVGAYDSNQETYADFSGRGFTRETRQVKPELVAPGVNIRSAAAGGGLTVKSGTSMAAPMVSGAAAMLMEWGIVRGNDPFLYGQKLKAYLLRGARQLPGENIPSKKTGFGALCLRNSIPG
ncbi:MAG: S8 family peptidase, partial [Eubacteriales bacterium]|nr:S8 family peptidase [Eubacteriales bacterium]